MKYSLSSRNKQKNFFNITVNTTVAKTTTAFYLFQKDNRISVQNYVWQNTTLIISPVQNKVLFCTEKLFLCTTKHKYLTNILKKVGKEPFFLE